MSLPVGARLLRARSAANSLGPGGPQRPRGPRARRPDARRRIARGDGRRHGHPLADLSAPYRLTLRGRSAKLGGGPAVPEQMVPDTSRRLSTSLDAFETCQHMSSRCHSRMVYSDVFLTFGKGPLIVANPRILRLQKDLHTGSISRDIEFPLRALQPRKWDVYRSCTFGAT